MSKIIDTKRVQEALDRAAANAIHGSPDVRAGRFVAAAASASLPPGKRRPMSKSASGRSKREGPPDVT
jgi:hypothetical protein